MGTINAALLRRNREPFRDPPPLLTAHMHPRIIDTCPSVSLALTVSVISLGICAEPSPRSIHDAIVVSKRHQWH